MIKVNCSIQKEFESDERFELLPEEFFFHFFCPSTTPTRPPGQKGEDVVQKVLQKGKRCVLIHNCYGNHKLDIKASELRLGDVLFFRDGDDYDQEIGEVQSLAVNEDTNNGK